MWFLSFSSQFLHSENADETGLKMKWTTYREEGMIWICYNCGAQIICLLEPAGSKPWWKHLSRQNLAKTRWQRLHVNASVTVLLGYDLWLWVLLCTRSLETFCLNAQRCCCEFSLKDAADVTKSLAQQTSFAVECEKHDSKPFHAIAEIIRASCFSWVSQYLLFTTFIKINDW